MGRLVQAGEARVFGMLFVWEVDLPPKPKDLVLSHGSVFVTEDVIRV